MVKTTIVLPHHFQAIAPGMLKEVQHTGDKVTYVFETTNPEVCFSVFADSAWIKTEREINGIRMQTLLHPESQKFAEQIFTTSSEILKFYSEIFSPYHFDQFSFITIRGMYARRAFSGFIGYEPKYLEKEFTTTGHDAHETALLWWDYTIRGSGPGSFQWFEGFGDYAELLYGEKYRKPIPKIFQFFRNKYLASLPENDLLYTELRGNTDQAFIHGKYPFLMHLIRYVVGDDEFKRAMRLLFEKFRFRTLSMNEFISTLEEGSGQSLQWFREEWLRRRGVPTISLKSEIQKTVEVYNITCVLEQIGNIYQLPVEIGIETAMGMHLEKVYLKERQMTFSFQSKEEPQRILLDPNDWIIMKKICKVDG
jgi:aminopeptidase N